MPGSLVYRWRLHCAMKEKVGIEIKNLRVTNVEEEQRKEPKIKSKEVMQLYKRRLMFIKYQKEEE